MGVNEQANLEKGYMDIPCTIFSFATFCKFEIISKLNVKKENVIKSLSVGIYYCHSIAHTFLTSIDGTENTLQA